MEFVTLSNGVKMPLRYWQRHNECYVHQRVPTCRE